MTGFVPGLCSVTMRHLGVEEVAKIAAECGLRAIEWGGDVHVPHGDTAAAGRARTATRAAGLDCTSYGSYLLADHDREPATILRVLDTAVVLGVPNVRVWTPFGIGPGAGETPAVIDALALIADAAAERDLTIGLEFHAGTLTATAASAADLVDRVGAPNLMTYWQPPYWLPDRPPEDDALEVKELAPRISHVHVYEWRGAEDRRPLSEGRSRWRAVLDAMRDAPGPECPAPRAAFLEFVAEDDPVALQRDAQTLHELLTAST